MRFVVTDTVDVERPVLDVAVLVLAVAALMLQRPRTRSIALERLDQIDVWLPATRLERLAITDSFEGTWLATCQTTLDNSMAFAQRVLGQPQFLQPLLALTGADCTAVGDFFDRLPNAPHVQDELRNVARFCVFLDLIQKLLHQASCRVLGGSHDVLWWDHPLEV